MSGRGGGVKKWRDAQPLQWNVLAVLSVLDRKLREVAGEGALARADVALDLDHLALEAVVDLRERGKRGAHRGSEWRWSSRQGEGREWDGWGQAEASARSNWVVSESGSASPTTEFRVTGNEMQHVQP